MRLSQREISNHILCARTYPTESQFREAVEDFGTWHGLTQACFPPYRTPAVDHDDGASWQEAHVAAFGEQSETAS